MTIHTHANLSTSYDRSGSFEIHRSESNITNQTPVTSNHPVARQSQWRESIAHKSTSLLMVRNKYDLPESPLDLALHESNQARVAEEVFNQKSRVLRTNPNASPDEIRLAIEQGIGAILHSAKFDPTPYRPKGTGNNQYGKYLIYSDENHDAPFCFQFFSFGAYQKTPIHDHPCECTSYVVFGALRERSYQIVDGKVIKTKKEDRQSGSLRSIDLSTNDPHSIKNTGASIAGTLHVYRIDGIEETVAVRKRYDMAEFN